jgi:hypothetical protein
VDEAGDWLLWRFVVGISVSVSPPSGLFGRTGSVFLAFFFLLLGRGVMSVAVAHGLRFWLWLFFVAVRVYLFDAWNRAFLLFN